MKIGIIQVGKVENYDFDRLRENLTMIFPKTTFTLDPKPLTTPKDALDEERQQHRSDRILSKIRIYTEKNKTLDRVIGIVDTDIFLPPLNYVFGQADVIGKAALVSLWRLRPEFYKKPPKPELLEERSTKESVHEIGHTLGLEHCANPFCVMYFSNSIFDTDRKQSLFCSKCYRKIETTINNTG